MSRTTPLKFVVRSVTAKAIVGELPHLDLVDVEAGATGRIMLRRAEHSGGDALHARRGDVLVNKLRPYLRKTALVERSITCSGEFLVLRPAQGFDARYLRYVVADRRFAEFATASVAGVKMPRTSWELIRAYPAWWPDARSQRMVADFLDRECQHAAAAVQSAARMVDRLSEPVHALAEREFAEQPMGRIGYGFDVQLGKMLDEKRIEEGEACLYLRNANVHWDELRLDDLKEMTFTAADRARFALLPGDLLVCEGGEPGRAAVWNGELSTCYYQKALHRVRPLGDQSSRYLMWALRVLSRRGAFGVDGPGRFTHLTAEMLRAVRVPMPDGATQRERVYAIDNLATRSRRAAGALNVLEQRLDEYRDALITEAVTGQIDVDSVSEAQMDERMLATFEG